MKKRVYKIIVDEYSMLFDNRIYQNHPACKLQVSSTHKYWCKEKTVYNIDLMASDGLFQVCLDGGGIWFNLFWALDLQGSFLACIKGNVCQYLSDMKYIWVTKELCPNRVFIYF